MRTIWNEFCRWRARSCHDKAERLRAVRGHPAYVSGYVIKYFEWMGRMI